MSETELKQSDSFACPSCAGALAFDPDSQSLSCPFCGYKQSIIVRAGDAPEYPFDDETEKNLPVFADVSYSIKCENCGSISQFDKLVTARRCAYCGSNHVIDQNEIHGIQPEYMIPFKVTKKKATDQLTTFLKKKWYTPKNLVSSFLIDALSGIYAPYWHYDADTISPYSALRGDYYYVTRTVGTGKNRRTVTERRTRWTPVSGTYSHYYDNVEVSASGTKQPNILNRVFPFNYEGLVQYDREYIAGFIAERYAIGLNQGWITARQQIHSMIESGIKRQIGGDTVSNLRYDTDIPMKRYKHILLPFYICAYQYKGKPFSISINGQTGKANGTYPVSAWKVFFTVIIVLAVIAIVLLILQQNGAFNEFNY